MATFPVLLSHRVALEAALVRISKRATKRGLSPLLFSWGKPASCGGC